jgi:hypothetical protein
MHDENHHEELKFHNMSEKGALSGVPAWTLDAVVTTQLLNGNNGCTGDGYTPGRGLSPIQEDDFTSDHSSDS